MTPSSILRLSPSLIPHRRRSGKVLLLVVISAQVALHHRDLHKPGSGGGMWACLPAVPDVYRHSGTETCTLDTAGAAWVPCPPASECLLLWLQEDIPWVRSSLCDRGTVSFSEAGMLPPPAMVILEHCHREELHRWSLVIVPALTCTPSVVRVTHGAPHGGPLLDYGSEPAQQESITRHFIEISLTYSRVTCVSHYIRCARSSTHPVMYY